MPKPGRGSIEDRQSPLAIEEDFGGPVVLRFEREPFLGLQTVEGDVG